VLKAIDSPYLVGRKRGYWWKYKVNPMSLDAVLLYAQAGSGKRANLFTDYTFALWQGEDLVPFAKAYSGLDNAEIEELDRWIRTHTLEKFGPVRSVEPVQVFEIGFEGIAQSNRHKSGIAVRFPRILRWRKDKPVQDADTLQAAIALLSLNQN
jgi:DNA ligase-1